MSVTENDDYEGAHVDLETLFNAVINSSAGISRIFQNGGAR
jgi:hypothetical protein